jgi:hypothetical protein
LYHASTVRFLPLVVCLLGCGPPPPITCEIGTGAAAFEPLTPGAPVDVILGPQGGHHLWTAVRVKGDPDLDRVQVVMDGTIEATGAPMGPGAIAPAALHPDPLVPGARSTAGLTNFVDNPDALHGQTVTMHIDAVTVDGRRCSDQQTVTVR